MNYIIGFGGLAALAVLILAIRAYDKRAREKLSSEQRKDWDEDAKALNEEW